MEENKNQIALFEQKYLSAFQDLQQMKKAKETLEKREVDIKNELLDAMKEYGIKSIKNEYITISGGHDFSTIGRHISIAATPGIAVASRQPILAAATGIIIIPAVSLMTLCINDTAPATAWPASAITPGAKVYHPNPALTAMASRTVSGETKP